MQKVYNFIKVAGGLIGFLLTGGITLAVEQVPGLDVEVDFSKGKISPISFTD